MNKLPIPNSRLAEGVAALKAGRRGEARRLLAQVVCADPKDATAWLWLSRCVDDERQRRECLERAVRRGSVNEDARRAVGQEAGPRLRQILGTGAGATANRAFHEALEPPFRGPSVAVPPDSRGLKPAAGEKALPGAVRQQRPASKDDASSRDDASFRNGAAIGNDATFRNDATSQDGALGNLASSTTQSQAEEPKSAERPSQLGEPGLSAVAERSSGGWWRRLALAALVVSVVALACTFAPRLDWLGSQAQPVGDEALEASGVIRAEEVLIASEQSGRIVAVPVDEGDPVAASEVLVQLDTALLDAQMETARAAIAAAEAAVAQARAGARPGQIAVAEAQLDQAKAARIAAAQAVSDTLALVENPQDIRLQIAVAQAQAVAAQHHVARAVALKDAAEIGKDKFEEVQQKWGGRGRRKFLVRSGNVSELPTLLPPEVVALLPTLGDGVYTFGDLELHLHGDTYDLYKWISASDVHIPLDLHLLPNAWWQAWVGVNTAVAQQEGIQASLAQLYAQRSHPQDLEAKADEALAAQAQAEAQVSAAQAQLDGLKAGATDEQIAALEARVAQAQAALDSLLTQQAKTEIASPVDGVVVDVATHPGEVALAGAALLTVADLSEVRLVVYLPETQIGQVHLGQSVQVTVDSFSDRVFEGQVTHIADRAEFTPRNVATKEERVNLVFAVEIYLPNEDGALKPGMPADAVFGG